MRVYHRLAGKDSLERLSTEEDSSGNDNSLNSIQHVVPGCDDSDAYYDTPTAFLSLLDHLDTQRHNVIIHQALLFILLSKHLSLPQRAPPLLLRIWAKLRCNSFAIKSDDSLAKSDEGNGAVQKVGEVTIGTGIYLKGSLVNHSCDPNSVVTFSEGYEMTLRTYKDLQRDGEITISYGPLKSRMGRDERKRTLRDGWFFECGCAACSESDAVDIAIAHACPKCTQAVSPDQPICHKCQSAVPVGERKMALHEADLLSDKARSTGSDKEAIKHLQKCLSIRQGILHPQNRILAQTYDMLAERFAAAGDFAISADYCQKGIDIISVSDGNDSIEVTGEQMKLAQLLFNSRQVIPARKAVDRAIELQELHFGKNRQREDLAELYEMKKYLMQF
ncbi:SET and MYND domain-containing protein 4 [Rhizophlyctis rosea]|nr:SET and MYND domain-containing protein 4 [Rhizophlyctis rosea]